jgi:phage shock protein A
MCEKERAERTGRVQIYSKQIDMSTAVIGRLTEHIAASQKQVDAINVEIKDNEDAKREATEIRNKEKVEYGESESDDTAAGQVVENAIQVLKSFYQNNELNAPGFVQVRAVQEDKEPGEAPTPPPSTWDSEYKGASGETGGIVALMEGIKADIEKDIRAADKEESDAQAAYDKLCADIDLTISQLKSTRSDLLAMIASDESSMATQKESRSTDQSSLQSHLDFLKEIATACDFMAANFESRMANRAEEVDGLNKAKATFSGASFD